MDFSKFKQGSKYKLVIKGKVVEFGRLFMKSKSCLFLIRKHAYDVIITSEYVKFLEPMTHSVQIDLVVNDDDLPF